MGLPCPRALLGLAAATVFWFPSHAFAQETGVTDKRVLFGQSAAFSGPAQELGIGMRLGIEAAFMEINAQGGVDGRELDLVSLDDAYEPEAAIANTRRLIEREKIFALIGAVGTPTSRSAVPVAAEAGVPYMAPFTGAAFLRDPKWTNVVNLRASYYQETEEIVDYLVNDLGIERIGVFYQDDSFGQAGYRGVRNALRRRDMTLVGTGVYPRNTTAVKTGLLNLRAAAPEAVIMVGAYEPVAAFVAWARRIAYEPVFATISFVGSNALIRELGPASTGIIVTQVVPDPLTHASPVATAYRRAIEAREPGAVPGFVSFEGYLAGHLAAAILARCAPVPDRACFLGSMANSVPIDLGGFELQFGDGNQGSDAIFMTHVDSEGRYRGIDRLQSRI